MGNVDQIMVVATHTIMRDSCIVTWLPANVMIQKLRKTCKLKIGALLFFDDFSSLEIYLATNMGQG